MSFDCYNINNNDSFDENYIIEYEIDQLVKVDGCGATVHHFVIQCL